MKLANLFFGLLLLAGVMNVTHAAVEEKNGFEHQTEAEFEAWCAQGTRALERARNTAAGQVAYGQFQSAAQTLIHALRSGVARPNWSVKPVTWRLMVHGEKLGSALLASVGNDTRGIKATVNALEGIYDLIVNSAYEIDRRYYFTRCGFCRGQRVRDFENRVLKMAGDLLALVNGHMSYARGGQVFPLGPARAYLVGAEALTSSAFGEIAELLYAESYACELAELQDLSIELGAFNSRTSSEYERAGMFYDAHNRIDGVVYELRQGRGCWER